MSYVKDLLKNVGMGGEAPYTGPTKIQRTPAAMNKGEVVQSFRVATASEDHPLKSCIQNLTKRKDDMMRDLAATSAEIDRLTQLKYEQSAIIEGLSRGIETMSMRQTTVKKASEVKARKIQQTELSADSEAELMDNLEAIIGDVINHKDTPMPKAVESMDDLINAR